MSRSSCRPILWKEAVYCSRKENSWNLHGITNRFAHRLAIQTEAKVFVCPSSSGRVVMKKEAILDAYEEAFTAYRSYHFSSLS